MNSSWHVESDLHSKTQAALRLSRKRQVRSLRSHAVRGPAVSSRTRIRAFTARTTTVDSSRGPKEISTSHYGLHREQSRDIVWSRKSVVSTAMQLHSTLTRNTINVQMKKMHHTRYHSTSDAVWGSIALIFILWYFVVMNRLLCRDADHIRSVIFKPSLEWHWMEFQTNT